MKKEKSTKIDILNTMTTISSQSKLNSHKKNFVPSLGNSSYLYKLNNKSMNIKSSTENFGK